MKNKLKWIAVILVIVVFAGAYSIIDKTVNIYNSNVDSSEYQAVVLQKGASISQTFVTEEKTLDGMEIKMTATGEPSDIGFHYELRDENGKVVVQKDDTLAELKNGKFYDVKFERLNGCRGKKYEFLMRLDSCGEGESTTVYVTQKGSDETTLLSNNNEVDGALVLRTISRRFDIETFVVTLVFLLYVILFMRWLGKLFK